ncbi:hypothetical protein DE146DRAFT_658965 [Phaeosphaeria sp. MPI-PUGE-AT-0046c]|nr:hypothetical protein DE146DRAFT_658965 [Phaeosphaeria sp. MPI-PUGE-AT-0046c]
MTASVRSKLLSLSLLTCFIPLVFSFWNHVTPSQPRPHLVVDPRGSVFQKSPKLLSHQSAGDPAKYLNPHNITWYTAYGVPLFYDAWKVKPLASASPLPTHRSTLYKHGARVACWPQSGGVWIKHADLVDLDHLGLSRQQDTPRQYDDAAEAAFCSKLRAVGAEWWSLPPDFSAREHLGDEQFKCKTLETCFEPQVRFEHLVAWPSDELAVCSVSVKKFERASEKQRNGYYNAMDMDERCNAIESLGGACCSCKHACPELEDLDWGANDPGLMGCGVFFSKL